MDSQGHLSVEVVSLGHCGTRDEDSLQWEVIQATTNKDESVSESLVVSLLLPGGPGPLLPVDMFTGRGLTQTFTTSGLRTSLRWSRYSILPILGTLSPLSPLSPLSLSSSVTLDPDSQTGPL